MTCDEWRARLATLQAAYDGYLTGGAITEVQTGDKRVRYGGGNQKDLLAALRVAQAKVDRCDGRCPDRVIGVVPLTR
jgi:hypothetical protein